MAGYQSLRMKRKDFEEVLDDFSDFNLSSPARKSRRLDAELPPIMEEEEPGHGGPVGLGQPLQEVQQLSAPILVEEVPAVPPVNEERALVLYKPVNSSPSLQSSSGSSIYLITLNSDLIPGLRDPTFWPGYTEFPKTEDRAESTEESLHATDRLAVVPWRGHQLPTASVFVDGSASEIAEPMEAEELVDGTMDIEVDNTSRQPSGLEEGDTLQKWQQPHCMTPQLPQNTSTPIMWSW